MESNRYILSSFGCLNLKNEPLNQYLKRQNICRHVNKKVYINTTSERVKTCPYCNFKSQSLRDCRCGEFNKFKQKVNKTWYISNKLKSEDELGFSSAGIIPYFKDSDGTIFLLFLEQTRKYKPTENGELYKTALNFAAGKRESYFDRRNEHLSPETSIQTAKAEFLEEVKEVITEKDSKFLDEVVNADLKKVFWTGKNKMALYFLRVEFNILKIRHNQNISEKSEARNFYIMPLTEMFNFSDIYHY